MKRRNTASAESVVKELLFEIDAPQTPKCCHPINQPDDASFTSHINKYTGHRQQGVKTKVRQTKATE